EGIEGLTRDKAITRASVTSCAGGRRIADFVRKGGDDQSVACLKGTRHQCRQLLRQVRRRSAMHHADGNWSKPELGPPLTFSPPFLRRRLTPAAFASIRPVQWVAPASA